MSKETILRGAEDMQWLKDVYGVNPDGFELAVLVGNEDHPEKILLYKEDSVHCKPLEIEYLYTVKS